MKALLFVTILVIYRAVCQNTVSGQGDSKSFPPCQEEVPCSVRVKSDIWKYNEVPRMDELDRHIGTERCRYKALSIRDDYFTFYNSTFRNLVKQRFGLRARDSAVIVILFGFQRIIYDFNLGVDQNTATTIDRFINSTEDSTHLDTPQLLTADSFVFFKITIDENELKLERDCGNTNPLFRADISSYTLSPVQMQFQASSSYGGKLAYDCLKREINSSLLF